MDQRAERLETLLANLAASVLVLFIFWSFSVLLVNGNYLYLYFGEYPGTGLFELGERVAGAPLKGIELLLVPLTALVVGRWRVGSDRFPAMRTARLGFMRPILLFASMFTVLVFFVLSLKVSWVGEGRTSSACPAAWPCFRLRQSE